MSALRNAALDLAGRGWHVFPLLPRRKTPATAHGFRDATTDVELVRAWWEASPAANIGVACGASRLLVVDLDGDEGRATWARRLVRHGRYVSTLTAETSSGWHLYFSGEGPTTTRRLGAGVDTRGVGGYAIAPCSIHPSGHVYRWLDPHRPTAPVPTWLLEALTPPAVETAVGERRELPTGVRVTRYGRVALEGLCDDLLAAPEGQRNATLHRVSRRAGRLVAGGELDEALAATVLLDAAGSVGLGTREAELTFRSGFAFGLQYPAARAAR